MNELSFLCLLKESVTHTLLHTPICNSSDLLIKRLPVKDFYRSDKDRGGLVLIMTWICRVFLSDEIEFSSQYFKNRYFTLMICLTVRAKCS